MQFLVTAHDYKDADAIKRRMAAREEHLAGATKLMQEGILLSAGAFLDDAGKMVGSSLIYQMDSKDELETLLNSDPYFAAKVWERFEIQEIKLFKPS